MGWRKILESEHRLMLEVADAQTRNAPTSRPRAEARIDLVGEIIGFFRYFCDGLHDPKEDGLLFARCHKRGMTNEDEPLEQMIGEHEWCRGELDGLERRARAARAGRPRGGARLRLAPARVRRASCAATWRSRRRSSSTRPSTTSPRRTATSSPRSSRPCTGTRSRKACSLTGRTSPTGSCRETRTDDEPSRGRSDSHARARLAPGPSPQPVRPVMSSAALRAAPIARITVAAPVTMSPAGPNARHARAA